MEENAVHTDDATDGWELRHDESSGQAYYVNLRTGESSWEAPPTEISSESVTPPHHQSQQWSEASDESGRVYYVNLETLETSWDPPPGYHSMVAPSPSVSVGEPLMRRPTTAEQMEHLNALLSGGGDGDDGEGEGEGEEDAAQELPVVDEERTEMAPPIADGSEWMMFVNETDGIPYYYNHLTGECVWEPPASFLEYHLQHSEGGETNPNSEVETIGAGHSETDHDNRQSTTTAVYPLPPTSPPPPVTPPVAIPVPITPEFEEKVRRAIESVSKTPTGSSRLLFVRTPTVKSIDSGRAGSRPTSSSGSARQRVATARVLVENEVRNPPAALEDEKVVDVETAGAVETVETVGTENAVRTIEMVETVGAVGAVEAVGTVEMVETVKTAETVETVEIVETAETVETVDTVETAEAAKPEEVLHEQQERDATIIAVSSDLLEDTPASVVDDASSMAIETGRLLVDPVEENTLQDAENDCHIQPLHPGDRVFDETALVIQCLARCFVARRRVARKRHEQASDSLKHDALEPQEPAPESPSLPVGDGTAAEEQQHVVSLSPDLLESEEPPGDRVAVEVDELQESEMLATITGSAQAAQGEGIQITDSAFVTEIQSLQSNHDPVPVTETVMALPTSYACEQSVGHGSSVDISSQHDATVEVPEVVDSESPAILLCVAAELSSDTEPLEENKDLIASACCDTDSVMPIVDPEKLEPMLADAEPVDSPPNDSTATSSTHALPRIDSESLGREPMHEPHIDPKPESTRRSARQSARSGRRSHSRGAHGSPSGGSTSPTREPRTPTPVDLANGRLNVLSVSSFFPTPPPRHRREPLSPENNTQPSTKPTSTSVSDGIVRKPLPKVLVASASFVSKPPRTDEQRQQERLARAIAMDKQHEEARAKWEQEVAQYQQIYADSAARSTVERQRVMEEAESLRMRAATTANRQKNEEKMKTDDHHSQVDPALPSVWAAAEDWSSKRSSIQDLLKTFVVKASEPHGFVDAMMRERLRTLQATVKRLSHRTADNQHEDPPRLRLSYWQGLIRSFPSPATDDKTNTGTDPYWTRLQSTLETIASGSPSSPSQYLASHRTDSFDSLLHMAAWHGHTEVIEMLVSDLQCDVNAVDNSISKVTPLHEASRGGHVRVVEYLLAQGAHLDARDAHGDTPLHVASRLGHSLVVHRLIAAGQACQNQNGSDAASSARVLGSLSWAWWVHWRNHKHRRAVDVATLPSLKELLTQYCIAVRDPDDSAHHSSRRSSSANSSAASTKTSKLTVKKKKKIKTTGTTSVTSTTSIAHVR